jgi:3-hydroxyisobutyrate dehydrogenase-like beta-hydroxyacid dehydrogenase
MTIAFLGLGNMGSGMASRLVAAGHPLIVWNRTEAKAEALVRMGARLAKAPEAAVAEADIVMTSLMDDASIRSMFDVSGKVFAALRPGATHLGLTTISPGCAEWLESTHKERGVFYVSGPVLGRPDAAEAGKLVEFLSGNREAIERLEPICRAFAERLIPIPGPVSTANKQKLCVNFFLASVIEAMSEGYTLADKLGASRQLMAGIFDQMFAQPGLKQYAARLFQRNTDGREGFAMTAGAKDIGLVLDAAREVGCPLELGEIIQVKMREALAQGMANMDWSAIQEISRRRAGLGN